MHVHDDTTHPSAVTHIGTQRHTAVMHSTRTNDDRKAAATSEPRDGTAMRGGGNIPQTRSELYQAVPPNSTRTDHGITNQLQAI